MYRTKKLVGDDEKLVGMTQVVGKRKNPVDNNQGPSTAPQPLTQCKYRNKVFQSKVGLNIHINNQHTERQSIF